MPDIAWEFDLSCQLSALSQSSLGIAPVKGTAAVTVWIFRQKLEAKAKSSLTEL